MPPPLAPPPWPPALAAALARTAGRASDGAAVRARMPAFLAIERIDIPTIVTITGTNGKGSVCAMLEACALGAGVRVGLFTSPHLWAINERVRVNGQTVDLTRLDGGVGDVARVLEGASFFEVLLFAALRIFREEGVQLAILEAGIGGRGDATGQVPAALSAITSIGLDHCAQLGPTTAAIAAEKAGIAHGTLVVSPQVDPEARVVIHATVRPGVTVIDAPALPTPTATGLWGSRLRFDGGDLTLPLCGAHQLANLATVRALVEQLVARGVFHGVEALRGVEHTRWPGRLEVVTRADTTWILDVAHNPEGLTALATALGAHVSDPTIVYGCAEGKDLGAAAPLVRALGGRLHLTGGFYRSVERSRLEAALPGVPYLPLEDVVGLSGVVVVTGSVFLVGEVRARLGLL